MGVHAFGGARGPHRRAQRVLVGPGGGEVVRDGRAPGASTRSPAVSSRARASVRCSSARSRDVMFDGFARSAWRKRWRPSSSATRTWRSTASRSASRSSPRASPVVRASARVVETLADGDEREDVRPGDESRSTRSMRASRSVPGAAPGRPRPREQLLAEQRVAAGPGPEAIEESGAGAAPRMSASWSASSSRSSGRRHDPPGAGVALEVGPRATERVAAVELVGAEGGDDEHAPHAWSLRARNASPSRASTGSPPVHVLDDEQDRALAAEGVQECQQPLEQARLPGVAGARARSRRPRPLRAGSSGATAAPHAPSVSAVSCRARAGATRRRAGGRELARAEVDAVAGEHACPPPGLALARGARPRRAAASCRPPTRRRGARATGVRRRRR